MNQKSTLLSASIFGCLAVALGAFGAHALKPTLLASGKLETYELATRYQFYHTLALLAIGILQHHYPGKKLYYAAFFMVLGILLFCGSLYLMCFVRASWLGPVTPVGGVLFILGWVLLFWGVYKR